MRPSRVLEVAVLASVGAKANSPSWAGTNNYFLIGMAESLQDSYLAKLQSLGTKVVRIWVNGQGQGSCQKGSKISVNIPPLESKIGEFDNTVLDAIDKVLVKLQKLGMKALLSPHDAANNNDKDPYFQKYGTDGFYQQKEAFDVYDKRLAHILNYTGKSSGKRWKEYREAIMGFDLQNEPMSTNLKACQENSGKDWPCGRAEKMRSILGKNSSILIGTGGVGGDVVHGCNFWPAVTSCAAIDMISVHRYAGAQASNQRQWSGGAARWLNEAGGKKVVFEEWGVNQSGRRQDPKAEYPAQAGDINKARIPWLYWQIAPPWNGGCAVDVSTDGDPFTLFIGGDVDLAGPMKQAAQVEAVQDWTGSVY